MALRKVPADYTGKPVHLEELDSVHRNTKLVLTTPAHFLHDFNDNCIIEQHEGMLHLMGRIYKTFTGGNLEDTLHITLSVHHFAEAAALGPYIHIRGRDPRKNLQDLTYCIGRQIFPSDDPVVRHIHGYFGQELFLGKLVRELEDKRPCADLLEIDTPKYIPHRVQGVDDQLLRLEAKMMVALGTQPTCSHVDNEWEEALKKRSLKEKVLERIDYEPNFISTL